MAAQLRVSANWGPALTQLDTGRKGRQVLCNHLPVESELQIQSLRKVSFADLKTTPWPDGVCQIVVMLLSLYEGLWAAPNPRLKPTDPRMEFDSIIALTRNLLTDTKTLSNHFKKHFPADGEHKLETLPVLSMNAVELANIQVSAGLVQFASDLQSYQRHFEWLKKAATWLWPMEHDIGTVHTRLERLLRRLEHMMTRLNITRPNDALPTLPTHGTHWSIVQAGHAIVHSFHLYLDWAARVLVLIRKKL